MEFFLAAKQRFVIVSTLFVLYATIKDPIKNEKLAICV